MSLKVFLELVEIKAKTASILPFLIGICFSYYYYNSVHLGLSVVFFVAMLLFNMAVDALDNYNDYHHAVDKLEYKRKTNIIGRENISPKLVFVILAIMTVIAAIILSFYLKLAPWTSLLALLAIPFIYKQDRMLMKEQVKSKTFKCAVKILAFGSFIQVLTYSIGLLFL